MGVGGRERGVEVEGVGEEVHVGKGRGVRAQAWSRVVSCRDGGRGGRVVRGEESGSDMVLLGVTVGERSRWWMGVVCMRSL